LGSWGFQRAIHFQGEMRNGRNGKGEMGTARAGKPPSLPRELWTPLVYKLKLVKKNSVSVNVNELFLNLSINLFRINITQTMQIICTRR
jgi:hypothetical protein